MIVPDSTNALLHNGTCRVIQCPVGKVFLFFLLHLNDDMLALVCDAIDIEDHTTVIGAQAKFFGLGKRHVLDYQLVFKQSVEECYQAFFRVLASKDSLESPIDTWVYKSSHLLTFYKVVDAILQFCCEDTLFIETAKESWDFLSFYANLNLNELSTTLTLEKAIRALAHIGVIWKSMPKI